MLHKIKRFGSVEASGPGAIDGFEAECYCGFKVRKATRSIALMDAVEHCLYMQKEARKRLLKSQKRSKMIASDLLVH